MDRTVITLHGSKMTGWWGVLKYTAYLVLIFTLIAGGGWLLEGAPESGWAFIVLAPVWLAVYLPVLLHYPVHTAHRQAVVDPQGMELVRHRMWWAGARRWRLDWNRVQLVQLTSEAFPETQSPGSRPRMITVSRPVLDLYLFYEADQLDRWLGGRDADESAPEAVELPAARVRLGTKGVRSEQSIRQLARVVMHTRPDVLRGLPDAPEDQGELFRRRHGAT